jgi:gamma-glutamyl:cysteine ligase YbdK (ATP-grasp superfamily)
MTREFFIAIDPITTVHMGICNAPKTLSRARALAAAIRSRHREFTDDPDNLPEYAAMHYMDKEVRKYFAERDGQQVAGSICVVTLHVHSFPQ